MPEPGPARAPQPIDAPFGAQFTDCDLSAETDCTWIDDATRDDCAYYHDWEVGDVVIWDQASILHRNAGDYDPTKRRIFLRTIVF